MSSLAPARLRSVEKISSREPGGLAVVLWMTAVGLALRVAFMLFFHTYEFEKLPAAEHAGANFPFGWETGSIAASIAAGHGFSSPFGSPTGPTTWIGPVYPYLCAAFFKLFGIYSVESAIAILTMNCLFAALTSIPLFFLAQRVFNRRTALWAGWTWALCPLFFRWPITWVWEVSLSALLTTIILWLVVKAADSPASAASGGGAAGWSQREIATLGAIGGFAILTNPALLIVSFVSMLWLAWRFHRQSRPVGKPVLLFAAVCFAVLLPWLVRNWVVFGRPVFIRGNFWVEFALGNYHLSNAMGWGGKHPSANLAEFRAYKSMGELGYVAAKKAESEQFLRQYPGEFFRLTLRRFVVFWDGEAFLYQPRGHGSDAERYLFAPFSILAGLGFWLAIRRRSSAGILFLAVALLYPAAYYITYSQPRYRQAIEPMMLAAIVYLLREAAASARRLLASR